MARQGLTLITPVLGEDAPGDTFLCTLTSVHLDYLYLGEAMAKQLPEFSSMDFWFSGGVCFQRHALPSAWPTSTTTNLRYFHNGLRGCSYEKFISSLDDGLIFVAPDHMSRPGSHIPADARIDLDAVELVAGEDAAWFTLMPRGEPHNFATPWLLYRLLKNWLWMDD